MLSPIGNTLILVSTVAATDQSGKNGMGRSFPSGGLLFQLKQSFLRQIKDRFVNNGFMCSFGIVHRQLTLIRYELFIYVVVSVSLLE